MSQRDGLLRRLEELAPALRRRFGESQVHGDLLSHFGNVTLHQLGALRHLKDGALTMNELASRVGISASAATQLVDRLVQHGMVDRVPDTEDRRILRVGLSGSASKVVESFEAARARQFAGLLSVLDEAELATLISLVEKVAGNGAPMSPGADRSHQAPSGGRS